MHKKNLILFIIIICLSTSYTMEIAETTLSLQIKNFNKLPETDMRETSFNKKALSTE